MRNRTYLWHFGDPDTEKVFACQRDEKWEAEEAFKEHLKKQGVIWDEPSHGDIGDYIEERGTMEEGDVWEV
jgi:hypothetical protein